MTYFDRVDICSAWYLWLSENHGGQSSEEYRRLSKLLNYFKPSPMLSFETLEDNAKEIYMDILDKKSPYSSYAIWVCQNCICAIANGDPFPEGAEQYEKNLEEYQDKLSELGSYLAYGGDSYGFSSIRCDTCDDLAGDRYQAFEMHKKEG